MHVSFLNLKALHESLQKEIETRFQRHLEKSDFILGESVRNFEDHFSQWACPGSFTASCANGTDAITLAAKALELPAGSEALVPAMTYYSTVSALLQAGLKVRLVDITPDTWLMDPREIAHEVTDKSALIVPVHLYGQMCPMDEIRALADQLDLKILEDSAQAHGATWKKKPVGFYADIATFSFYPSKNLGCLGDGGAVLSKSAHLIDRVRKLRNLGAEKKGVHEVLGYNSRLDALQASVLDLKLKYIEKWNRRRREIAKAYREVWSGISGLTLPTEQPDAKPVYHLYVVKVEKRESFIEYLKSNEIETGIHYTNAIHQHPAFKELFDAESFPEADHLARHGVSLPMCPTLTDAQVEFVTRSIKNYF